MDEPLRLALVGCGAHADAHVRACLAVGEQVHVVATCDLDEQRARHRSQELGGAAIYTEYAAVLNRSDVEAVLLCLPHLAHAPATIEAAAAGKHVLVEKPIATTLEDALAMVKATRNAGVTLMVAHHQRFDAQHQQIRTLLDEGALGEIYCARADHNMYMQPPPDHWLRREAEAGGGAMLGYGIHRVDLLQWLVGPIAQVAHFQRRLPGVIEGETSTVTILTFDTGAIGEIAVNWAVHQSPWMDLLFLYGTEGTLHNAGGVLEVSRVRAGSSQFRPVDLVRNDPFVDQLRHFVTCVREGREPLTNGVEATRALEVCLAAYRSAATGTVVRVSGASES